MRYAYPNLCFHKYEYDFRLFRAFIGTGLGNLLIPWAKSIVAAKEFNLKPIFPTWRQFHIGPLLKLQKDKRVYGDLFKASEQYAAGVKKIALLLKKRKITEEEFLKNRYKVDDDSIVLFGKMDNFFLPYNELGELYYKNNKIINEELLNITLPKHKTGLEYNFDNTISLHVRCGENATPDMKRIHNGASNIRYPIEWYCRQIEKIRDATSSDMQALIFSDGSDEELGPLLQMNNVARITFGTSIADMLALSRANILITSSSSFSKIGSFLGRMPVIWHKGQLTTPLYYEAPELEIEQEDNSNLPQQFIDMISNKK